MGWQDRDYTPEDWERSAGPAWLPQRLPKATLTLLVLHGAAFIAALTLFADKSNGLAAYASLSDKQAHPLAIVLHPLATTNLLLLIFVILALWSIGPRLERTIGAGRFVCAYVLANLAAGAVYFGLARLVTSSARAPLDHALGGIAGIGFLAWQRFRYEPAAVFGHLTTVGRVYSITAGVIVLLHLLRYGPGGAAWLAAALAGVGAAVLLDRTPWDSFTGATKRARRGAARFNRQAASAAASRSRNERAEAEIDQLLEKISRGGIDSLTPAERARLERARRDMLRRQPDG